MSIGINNIIIRTATPNDVEQLNKWWNDGSVMKHAGFPNGLFQSLEETKDNINNWNGEISQLCIIEIDGKAVGELSYKIKDGGKAYTGWKTCRKKISACWIKCSLV